MKHIIWLFCCLLVLSSCQNDNRALVVGKIHKASKLATTEFTVDKIVHGSKSKSLLWFIKLSEAKFIAYSKAKIKTGIDLQKLTKDDIIIEDNSITIQLPAVEVINFSYPPESFDIDPRISDNKFLNSISIYDQEEFFRKAEIDIRNNLKYMGIVETTQQKTRVMLNALLSSLGYEEIYIVFPEGDQLIIDEVPLEEGAA